MFLVEASHHISDGGFCFVMSIVYDTTVKKLCAKNEESVKSIKKLEKQNKQEEINGE